MYSLLNSSIFLIFLWLHKYDVRRGDHMSIHKKIIAISGSIREGASNTNVLKTLAAFIPEGIDYTIYNGIGELPHFNPDVDLEHRLLLKNFERH